MKIMNRAQMLFPSNRTTTVFKNIPSKSQSRPTGQQVLFETGAVTR